MELRELGGVFNEMIGSLEANEAARTSEITQRRQSEIELMALRDTLEFQVQVRTAALERTEERLRLITDSLPVLISYIDAERRYRFNNRTYEDWFGYAPGQALGKTMPEVLGEAAYQALLPYVEQALSGQMAYFEMFTPYERGPRYIDGLYVPDMDEAGEVIGFYVLVMDITQRKRIEAQNTALFNITAAFSGALTVEQVAGVIVKQGLAAMGARTAALFLLTPDETQLELVSGSSLNAATRRESASVSLDNRMATTVVMRTQKPLWFENLDAYEEMFPGTSPVLRQHGLEAVAYLPLNSGGRMIGSIGVGFAEPRVFDEPFKNFITTLTGQCALAVERAQLYEAEAAARAAAEQASAARLKFLAMVSHELRTPLATIKGFSSTLLATDVVWDAAAQGRFIRLIDEEADHLTELIEQLLDLSRIQAGTLRIHLQTQSVEAILEAAQPRLTALAVRHELTVDVAPGLSPVLADRERIVQVVSNLVENAVKYSPPASPILVQITEEGGYVRFDVVDRGVGIPAEERDRVFEAFYQADRKEQPKGAGLGLAICKGLIEAHGGTIWLGEQDLGTRVSFTLPAQHAAVAVLAVPAASEDGAG
jgi:PAS domain S-box-containing protein